MLQRLGLTIKRRAHFTNIYGPFCPDCGQAAESKKALQTHLAMAHGKRLTHYKRKEKSAVLGNLSRPLNIESLDLKGKLPKEYLSDMKRIWRLSGVGHSDLVLVERITRKPPKEKALYPIYVAIVTSGVVEAITTAPKRMRRVTEYVRQHSDLVRGIRQQHRYVRLKTPEAKAKLLSLGLANPTISLTYAERSKAKARDFKKDQRVLGPKGFQELTRHFQEHSVALRAASMSLDSRALFLTTLDDFGGYLASSVQKLFTSFPRGDP